MEDYLEQLKHNVDILYQRVLLLLEQSRRTKQRMLVAFVGTPGSGKSTITTALLVALRERGISNVAVLPMDGFHYPKSVLRSFADPKEAFRRRGAPFTFDAHGLIELVAALKAMPVTNTGDPTTMFHVPSFDHALQDPVIDDICISSSDAVVILEGNYLLLNEAPWNKIASMVNAKWLVDIPREVAKQRLVERHVRAGIEHTYEAAAIRAEENDLMNADLIRSKMILPDLVIQN